MDTVKLLIGAGVTVAVIAAAVGVIYYFMKMRSASAESLPPSYMPPQGGSNGVGTAAGQVDVEPVDSNLTIQGVKNEATENLTSITQSGNNSFVGRGMPSDAIAALYSSSGFGEGAINSSNIRFYGTSGRVCTGW